MMTWMQNHVSLLLIGLLGFPLLVFAATPAETNPITDPAIDPITGAETWRGQKDGVVFQLTQILPDQARAFYSSRGLSAEQLEPYASSCVYMTVMRNESAPGAVSFKVTDWSVVQDDKTQLPLLTEDWLERMQALGVKKSGLLSFRWAQFPQSQSFEPGGDWNQGMLSTGLEPGSRFDLVFRWRTNGQLIEGTLYDVQCAQ